MDVDEASKEAELAWLSAEIYQSEIDLLVKRIAAHDRFSDRGWESAHGLPGGGCLG